MSDLRSEVVSTLTSWCSALLRHASPHCARISIGSPRACYEPVWDELQGFSRPLWAMSALAASGEGLLLGADVWNA